MVGIRVILFLTWALFSLTGAWAAAPVVSADVDPSIRTDNGKLEGKISIYHLLTEKIDEASFFLDNTPLKVEFLFTTKLSEEERNRYPQFKDEAVVSVYRFQIPGQPKGLYSLASTSVKVGGHWLRSVPTTYQVTVEQSTPSLALEARVEGPQPLYPGQRAKFIYRITFDQPTELTKEELPLLKAEGFEKIGAEEITNEAATVSSTQEISQEVRAVDPGSYTFGLSTIEGVSFELDAQGQKVYQRPVLHAEAPSLKVVVAPFPEDGKPLSFTGAVGPYTLDVRLLSSYKVSVGDELRLAVQLIGTGDLETVQLPDIACQPGFGGFFEFDDFPPTERKNEFTKQFTLLLRSLSSSIKAVPPVVFTYFDPSTTHYVRLESPPIPIEVVREGAPQPVASPVKVAKEGSTTDGEWRAWLSQPQVNELGPQPALQKSDLVGWALSATVLSVVAASGVLLLALQDLLKDNLKWRLLNAPHDSQALLARARRHRSSPGLAAQYIERALLTLLAEEGIIQQPLLSPDRLPSGGAAGDVRALLLRISTDRFGGGRGGRASQWLSEAQKLYDKIKRKGV